MIGIWSTIMITMDSIKNNQRILGFFYSGKFCFIDRLKNGKFCSREIFYFTEENFLVARFLSHLPNSLLRVINNDTCEELPLVFNRLAPRTFSKNKVNGFDVEWNSIEGSIVLVWLHISCRRDLSRSIDTDGSISSSIDHFVCQITRPLYGSVDMFISNERNYGLLSTQ